MDIPDPAPPRPEGQPAPAPKPEPPDAEGVRRQREHIEQLTGEDPLRGGIAD
jgi:hypothetical protein